MGETQSKEKFSAKFKRDYVAALAVVLFILIFCLEVAMAVGIPLHLRDEMAWSEESARQETVTLFDAMRDRIKRYKGGGTQEKLEIGVYSRALDLFAIYLRGNGEHLSPVQVEAIRRDMDVADRNLARIMDSGAFALESGFSEKGFIDLVVSSQQKREKFIDAAY